MCALLPALNEEYESSLGGRAPPLLVVLASTRGLLNKRVLEGLTGRNALVRAINEQLADKAVQLLARLVQLRHHNFLGKGEVSQAIANTPWQNVGEDGVSSR